MQAMQVRSGFLIAAMLLTLASPASAQRMLPAVHAISHHGEPQYGPDAKQLDYVNPNAPKGGEIKLSDTGGFDSFHPFIVRGNPAPGVSLIYETLLESVPGEGQITSYGLIAESIELASDNRSVIFNLRKEARFHDGKPITADDVIFSFNMLKEKGAPHYRLYYASVSKAEALSPTRVRFQFQGDVSLELPLILGQLNVLPKHYWEGRDFERTTLEPPLGSGAYRIKEFEANRFVVYERVPDYWGKDIFFNRGRYNFDRIRYDSYRDTTVLLEAFKAGQYDFRVESSSRDWATGYDIPAVRNGLAKREEIKHDRPTGMQAYVFNTRREKFADPRVRQALGYAFDFEWANKNLFYGLNTRTKSFFSNSDFASRGLPSAEELKLLDPFRDKVPAEVFSKQYEPPMTDGSGNLRDNLRIAVKLLSEAGWTVKEGKLRNAKGQTLEAEFLLVQPEFERVVSPYIRNLERLGISAGIRVVDSAQYQNRVRDYDYDVIIGSWPQSIWPGNEQRDFWGSMAADRPGGRNTVGIKNPVVDQLIEKVAAAPDRDGLIAATRALDRVLLWNHYVVPQWHRNADWIAYWDKFGRPEKFPKDGVDLFSWWVDPAKEANVRARGDGKP